MVGTANFELAAGAIATARAALNALHWDEETTRFTNLRSKWFRCKMCAYGVCEINFEDLVSTYQSIQPWVEPLGRPHTCNSSATARDTPHNPSRTQVITTTGPNTRT